MLSYLCIYGFVARGARYGVYVCMLLLTGSLLEIPLRYLNAHNQGHLEVFRTGYGFGKSSWCFGIVFFERAPYFRLGCNLRRSC